jgi:hypothetical protein
MNDEAIGALLTATLTARTEWDEHPELYFLTESDNSAALVTVGLSSMWWDLAPPPQLLMRLGEGLMHYHSLPDSILEMPKPPVPELPPGWIGMAFRFEGWGVNITAAEQNDDPAVAERLKRAVAEHDLYLQPERIEARHIMAFTTADRFYHVEQERDCEVVMMPSGDPGGTIAEALMLMTFGFKAATAERQ